MENKTNFNENEIVKKAVLMLKDNLSDMKSYLSRSISPTVRLQKIKVEILKIDDRLNDIYNVLNANAETKLTEAKKLCNILQDEARAIIEEKQQIQNNGLSDEEYKEYIAPLQEVEFDQQEYEKWAEEKYNKFLKKHNNFRSVFDEYYEDKDLDKDMKILKDYLEQNNMLSGSLVTSSHDLVAIHAKLVVARHKSKIKELVIPKEENAYKTDKDYSRYEIICVKPAYVKSNLSKRKLPTEIFTYLISNNILTAKDFKKYSINQFGRTFEAKMGDIILDNELPEALDRQKRYNKVDFSQYPKSDFKGTLYISNQWDKNSIDKLINDIELNYGQHLSIITPDIANIVAYAYDRDISSVEKYNDFDDILSELDELGKRIK